MKSAILAGAMTLVIGTVAFADGQYWVAGNRASSKCDVVTSNPVIYLYGGGNIWFGDGPYRSVDDANLARSTISACPKEPPPSGECEGSCDQDKKD